MTVELITGRLREPNPVDYITKLVAVAPAPPSTPATLWTAFLNQITAGDLELQAYLQRVAGYCLTGDISEHVLFFLYGTGANGKSVYVNTLVGLWNDYAVTIGTDMLMVSHNDRHPTEIARLRGARLAVGNEVEIDRTWAENKIKALTGGDRLQGRFMRQDFFEFEPQFKLMVIGNNKPSLRGVDEAIRRRLHLIPFTVTIPPGERDPKLPDKLSAPVPPARLGPLAGGAERDLRPVLRSRVQVPGVAGEKHEAAIAILGQAGAVPLREALENGRTGAAHQRAISNGWRLASP